jgi:cyclic beta-1,2-glucan synthetase
MRGRSLGGDSESFTAWMPLHDCLLSMGPIADNHVSQTSLSQDISASLRTVVSELNNAAGVRRPFVLLHRELAFSETQQQPIGWERKWGKLLQLNAAILRGEFSGYSVVEGDVGQLSTTPYVFVMDDDSSIASEDLLRLISTLEHPQNRPYVSGESPELRNGYCIAQPLSVTRNMDPHASLPTSRLHSFLSRHRWPRMFPLACYPSGTAPDRSLTDMVTFGEVAFTGKGLYHVASYDALVGDRLPGECILNHDLCSTYSISNTRTAQVLA